MTLEENVDVRQYLSFRLAGNRHALPVERVREIRGFEGVTPVPGVPDYMLGVMNLRGQLLPVVDLRCRLGLDVPEMDRHSAVVLTECGERVVGAVVDRVDDVIEVEAGSLQPIPELSSGVQEQSLEGMLVQKDGDVVLVLSVDTVLNVA